MSGFPAHDILPAGSRYITSGMPIPTDSNETSLCWRGWGDVALFPRIAFEEQQQLS